MTEIFGTYRQDMEIGKLYNDLIIEVYGDKIKPAFKITRECTEQEWRDRYNYTGPLPASKSWNGHVNKENPRFYEIEVLD